MEDINRFALSFVEDLAKHFELTEEDEDKLFELFSDGMSLHFKCCDYRSYL